MVDTFVELQATDNRQDARNNEDDQYRHDEVNSIYCLEMHMKQVENKPTREKHKYYCPKHFSYANNHTLYFSSIRHTQTLHSMFQFELDLFKYNFKHTKK